MNEFIDLSHILNADCPAFPGDPQIIIQRTAGIENNGYRMTQLKLSTHTATHVDAPAHMISDGRFLNQYPVSRFTGRALVIKIPEGIKRISKQFLSSFEKDFSEAEFVLFNTGWGKYWGKENYFAGFPVPEAEAAEWLTSFYIKGIGIDTPSVDPSESTSWDIHHILFYSDLIIVENLVFPEIQETITGDFFCFPLSLDQADGSPVRALLQPD